MSRSHRYVAALAAAVLLGGSACSADQSATDAPGSGAPSAASPVPSSAAPSPAASAATSASLSASSASASGPTPQPPSTSGHLGAAAGQRPAVAPVAELPGGGTTIFPDKTYVALYGYPGTRALGVLGEQGTAATVKRAKAMAAKYRPHTKRTVVPALEIIATIAAGSAGSDRNYSTEAPISRLRPLVDAAGESGVYVVLDLQPGRASLLSQAKLYQELLQEPHVGLALDPEWKLTAKQKPLRQIGSVHVDEINEVADWLATLTRVSGLPQKMLLLHQFQTRMIRHRSALETGHPELAIAIQMDGQGGQSAKRGTWAAIRRNAPDGVVFGWKNFHDEDHPMLGPKATMRIKPQPRWVSYQ